jgi:CelD/BcsL family acetyltransferase involved in cellulose biosynthesis
LSESEQILALSPMVRLGATADRERSPFADVAVAADFAAAEAAWAELEEIAPVSVYQTQRWLRLWSDTIGRAKGIVPMLIIARDLHGSPMALLPLGISRRGMLRIAGFLGGKESNANLGLFRPGPRWTTGDIAALLAGARARSPVPPDLFRLLNQPLEWHGQANPLALLPHQPSPSYGAYGFLAGDAQQQALRKKLRKKARRLEGRFGPIRHVRARDAATARAILEAFHAQKSDHLRARGLPDVYGPPAVREFLSRGATETFANGQPSLELHGLFAGDRITATFGGAGHGGRFCGMFISYDSDIEIARSSPGELLLSEVVAQKRAEGFDVFDLGIGEASYKAHYCDQIEALVDTIVPMNLAGRTYGGALAALGRAKRSIKQSPRIWAGVSALRSKWPLR